MKLKNVLAVVFLLCAVAALGQVQPQITGAGAPTNPCYNGGQQYLDTTNHLLYGCPASGSNWSLLGLGNLAPNTATVTGSGAPSGNCSSSTQYYLNTANGDFYDCPTPGSTWVKIAGAGGGTISGVTAGTGLSGGGTSGTVTVNLSTPVTAANGGTGVVNSNTLTLGTTNINFATLGTGLVKNTTTTGALTNGAVGDVTGLFASCSGTQYLGFDGNCHTAGTGTITGVTAGTNLTGGGSSGGVTLNVTPTPVFGTAASIAGSIGIANGNASGTTITITNSTYQTAFTQDMVDDFGYNVMAFGALLNGTGVTGGGHDDGPAYQACLTLFHFCYTPPIVRNGTTHARIATPIVIPGTTDAARGLFSLGANNDDFNAGTVQVSLDCDLGGTTAGPCFWFGDPNHNAYNGPTIANNIFRDISTSHNSPGAIGMINVSNSKISGGFSQFKKPVLATATVAPAGVASCSNSGGSIASGGSLFAAYEALGPGYGGAPKSSEVSATLSSLGCTTGSTCSCTPLAPTTIDTTAPAVQVFWGTATGAEFQVGLPYVCSAGTCPMTQNFNYGQAANASSVVTSIPTSGNTPDAYDHSWAWGVYVTNTAASNCGSHGDSCLNGVFSNQPIFGTMGSINCETMIDCLDFDSHVASALIGAMHCNMATQTIATCVQSESQVIVSGPAHFEGGATGSGPQVKLAGSAGTIWSNTNFESGNAITAISIVGGHKNQFVNVTFGNSLGTCFTDDSNSSNNWFGPFQNPAGCTYSTQVSDVVENGSTGSITYPQLTLQQPANTAVTPLTITQGAASTNFPTAALQITQGANTGATNIPGLNMSGGVWNNASLAGPLIQASVTNTSSAATSLFLNFLAGAAGNTSIFKISSTGTTTATGGFVSAPTNAAGFTALKQGTTQATLTTSITDQAPTSVTSYINTRPGVAAQGLVTGTLSGSVITQGFSGDAGHSATVGISTATSVGSTSLCSTALCPAGTYLVTAYIDVTTACTTTGTYFVNLIYTDDTTVSKTTVMPLFGTGVTTTTGPIAATSLAMAATTNYATGSFILRSTGAASINYSTTAGACGSGGPGLGKLYLAVVPVQ